MLTMTSALVRAAETYPNRPAMIHPDGQTETWSDHVARIAGLAGCLRAIGLERGDRFALLAPNSVRQAEMFHAGYWAGISPVPLNYRLSPVEISAILSEAQANALFIDGGMYELAAEFHRSNEGFPAVLMSEGNSAEPAQPFQEFQAKGRPVEAQQVSEGDEAILLYTGGTTGSGKGVPLTHRNVVSNGFQVGLSLSIRSDDIKLHVAPMFHSADLLGTAVTLAGGAHCYLAAPTPPSVIEAIEAYRATYTMVPPILLQGLVSGGLLADRDLARLRIFLCGGAPVPFDLIQSAQNHLPNGSMVQGYGLTETSPILTFMHLRQTVAELGEGAESCKSSGRPLPGTTLRIVNSFGGNVAAGEAGELLVSGPNVMEGYHQRPAETDAVLRDGWFHTGDIAWRDSNGYVHIVDRKKDMIITGGENVYSVEVETVLLRHPAISDAAVIGLPDEKYGERVTAVIVADENLGSETVQRHCRDFLGGFKVPRIVHVVDQLPKSAMGKTLKAELRAQFA